MDKINFTVENMSDVAEDFDDSFSIVSIDAFASGDNDHHMFVSEETLKKYADTIYDKPILYKIDNWTNDLGGHEPDEQICGYIDRENNPITFRTLPDGRMILNVKGKIWRKYSKKLLEILKRNDGKKAVSVEMDVPKFDKIKSEIKEFIMRGITIIGTKPAIPMAEMTVLNFSNGVWCFESKNSMVIDNSKESAINPSSWANEGRKFYNVLLSKNNKLALLNEAYLVVDESKIDSAPSEALKYPHHSIKDGKLVLNIKGLYAARQRASQQNIDSGKVLAHLKKHYSELGESFDVGKFSTEIKEQEDKNLEDEKVMMEEEKKEEMAVEKQPEKEPKKEEPKEEVEMAVEEEKKEEPKEEEFECGKVEYEAKIAEFSAKIEAYEKELEVLRKFKSDREEQDKTFALEKLFSEVGESLSKEKLEEFRGRSEIIKFSDVPAFSNEVKAATFDVVKNSTSEDSVKRMAKLNPAKAEKKSPWSF